MAEDWPTQYNKVFFCLKGQKNPLVEGQNPPQELEVGPRGRPYLLVQSIKTIQYILFIQSIQSINLVHILCDILVLVTFLFKWYYKGNNDIVLKILDFC